MTSFERTNLTFSVHKREGLGSIVSQLIESKKRDGEVEPTLIYTNTTGQVDEVADYLEQSGHFSGSVAK